MASQKQPELCRRRGINLAPIITKCFDLTDSSTDTRQVARTALSPLAVQDKCLRESDQVYEEISRWSSTTDSSSYYSDHDTDQFDPEESHDQRLERYRNFFNTKPLMRCLDTGEDQLLADLLFESLLRELQRPGLPFDPNFRGEIQIITFWDDVRMQLRFDEDGLEDEQEQE
jgi:hypothetical protein